MGLASKLAAAQQAGAPAGYPPQGAAAAPPPRQQATPSAPPMQQSWPPAAAQQGYPPAQQAPGAYPPATYGAPASAPGYPPATYGAPAAAPGAPSYPPAAYGAPAAAPGYPPAAYGAAPPGAQQLPPPGQAAQQWPPQQAGFAPPQAAQQGYPPAAYGAPAAAAAPPGAQGGGAGSLAAVRQRLAAIVGANGLQRFYPPQQLEAVAQRVARVDFHSLAARWRMPVELALDFAALALYDTVLYADDSGSMAFEEGGERIEDLKLILSRVAEIATLFDDDGIVVRFMNSGVEGNGIRSAADAAALLTKVTFGGTTPLAASMHSKVVQGVVMPAAARGALAKPVLVISITDGEPTDTPKDAILQVIRDARARLAQQYGPRAIAFQFAQVGRDARAQAFLSKLDQDPGVGDIIDCTSYFELEAEEFARKGVTLSVEAWLLKLMVGSIDPSYDAEDEGPTR